MKGFRAQWIRSLVLIMICAFFVLHTGLLNAAQCFIVRIAKESVGGEHRIYLYPSELKVPKDSCVIWVSWIEKENVSINFDENSKSCILATESASGFIEAEGCFLTDFLTYGKTVSLNFKEAGTFSYKLEVLEKSAKPEEGPRRRIVREGKVVVE
ncbi:MAG: hypothetical protein RBT11_13485 [Desulfobacterales bacterium]|jgi:hypothetical protein|nr:hypothetical protein [Desulfobacterales bacterium]